MRDTEKFVNVLVNKCFEEYMRIPGRAFVAYRESTETEDGDVVVLGADWDMPEGYWPSSDIPMGATNEKVRDILKTLIRRLPIMKYGDLDD